MSSPAAARTGLLGTVASGYRLAWAARRPLSAVLLPVVAAMLLSWSLLDVALGRGRLVIVDGIAGPREADVLAWAKLASTVVCWLVGLIGGAVAVTGGAGPAAAVGRALRRLPVFLTGLAAAAVGTLAALHAAAGLGPVAVLALLVAAALLAALVLLSGIASVVGGPAPRWAAAGAFLLGGVVVPLLAGYGVQPALMIPYAGALAAAALLVAVLAVQVGLAAHRPDRPPVPARLWPGAAMVVAAVLVSAGVVVLNPYAAPSVRTHGGGPAGAMAVAWPAGQHPVIVTSGGVWFCDDDLCEEFTDVHGGPPTVDGFGSAGIAADGTVVKVAVTGGPESGGPFVNYARCVRQGCRQSWLPIRATAAEKLDNRVRVEVAGAAAPDGALWLFVAAPVAGGAFGRYRFSLIRCADVACASPQRHPVGVVDRTPQDGYSDGRRARLAVDAFGRPAASFWLGGSVLRFTCAPVSCAGPRESATQAGPPDAVWEAAGGRAVSFRAGELYDGAGSAPIAVGAAAPTGALAVAGSSVYVAAALPGTPASGLRLTIGEPATSWRQTVWRCRDAGCVSTPMDVYPGPARRELLAVADDGRVLVVRDDRIAMLQTPPR